MSKKMDNEWAKTFESYRELVQRRTQLEDMLGKAEAEKTSVKADIYDRVCKDYQSALDEVSRDLSPLQTKIEDSRRRWLTEFEEIERGVRAVEEKLEEAEFRHKVGEYDEHRYSGLESPLKKKLEDLSETRSDLKARLDEFDALTNDMSIDESAPTEVASDAGGEHEQFEPLDVDATESVTQPAAQHAWLSDAANKTEKEPAAEKSRTDDDELIDLREWPREFRDDNTDRRSRADTQREEPTVATEDGDAFSDLADPLVQTTEDDQTADEGDREEIPAAFPILIITKGPGAGKKLPLVPMTMTLGREHDNNIELKDEDVARYHARISYKSGSYLLQDLESSSGTWLNDEKITEATLQHGDKLRVGATEMMVDFE